MSIRRQLIILVSTLMMVVFAGTLYISVKNTQTYLSAQLKAHAQDTATSLGLSLIPAIQAGDKAKVDSMMDVIFDRGYYSDMQLEKDGVVWLSKNMDVWTAKVPAWFINSMPLQAPTMHSELSIAWVPSAKLSVTVHTGYAYEELWDVAKQNFFWLLLLALVIYFIIFVGLKRILIPLDQTEKQALAIANREFTIQASLPKTRELQNVVKAMNHMSHKVQENFSEQVELVKKYKDLAYIDALTGKINKRGLIAEIESFICNREEFLNGAFFIAQLSGIDSLNKTKGYEVGDQLIVEVAKYIDKNHMSANSVIAARIAGSAFGVLIKNPYMDEAEEMIVKILEQFSSHHQYEQEAMACQLFVGLTEFNSEKTSVSLFSEADLALRTAQSGGKQKWARYERTLNEVHTVRTASQWRDLIKQALENEALDLFIQPLQFFAEAAISSYEVLVRINESGNLIPAGTFMPMAEHHGLCEAVDRQVCSRLLPILENDKQYTYAINLSIESIQSQAFCEWLLEQLEKLGADAQRCLFEVKESLILHDSRIQERLLELGQHCAGLALENFGARQPDFSYLQKLKFKYIKVAGHYIHHIIDSPENQFYIKTLVQMSHGLDTLIIAEMVESEEMAEMVQKLGMDGAQGYFYGRPTHLL